MNFIRQLKANIAEDERRHTEQKKSILHQNPAEKVRLGSQSGQEGEQSRATIESTRAQANTPLTEIAGQRTQLTDLSVQCQTAIQQRDAVATTAQIDFGQSQARAARFPGTSQDRSQRHRVTIKDLSDQSSHTQEVYHDLVVQDAARSKVIATSTDRRGTCRTGHIVADAGGDPTLIGQKLVFAETRTPAQANWFCDGLVSSDFGSKAASTPNQCWRGTTVRDSVTITTSTTELKAKGGRKSWNLELGHSTAFSECGKCN